MNRLFSLCLLPALLVAHAAFADEPAGRKAELVKQIRQLEKDIEKVRGLKFLKPVEANVIPRGKDDSPGIQGYYDTKKKALFIYDDIKGNYEKGVLVHEMVHALQDQHFGLGKLHASTFGTDAEMALAALIEGDATLTMIRLLGKEQPHAAKMLSVPLEKSKNLQNAFLYAQGARYVQALEKRGGWSAVDMRYPFPPTSTASILHPDERITPVNLGPGKRVGEYGLDKNLAAQPITQPISLQAASGWRGDRTITEKDASAWIVAFAKPEQAAKFHDALIQARTAEYPKAKKLPAEPGASLRQSAKGAYHGILLRGSRVWEIDAPTEKEYRSLIDRLEGPALFSVWSGKEKKTLTPGEFMDRLMEADAVCIGETHDSEIHHQAQLAVIKALYARDERLGVGFEMFQRPFQKSLDRFTSGAIDEASMLEDTEYKRRWGYDWALYRPIADFCRRNRVPMAALNVGDDLRKRVSSVGFEKLTGEEKKQIGEVDFQVKEHRAHWFDQLGEMHGHGKMTKEGKETFYQVMTLWDEFMADSAARFQADRKLRRVVVLAGSGHIDRGFGIPGRLAKRTKGKVVTVRIFLEGDLEKMKKDPAADFVLMVQ